MYSLDRLSGKTETLDSYTLSRSETGRADYPPGEGFVSLADVIKGQPSNRRAFRTLSTDLPRGYCQQAKRSEQAICQQQDKEGPKGHSLLRGNM